VLAVPAVRSFSDSFFFERQIATPDTRDTKLLIIKMLVVAETCGQGNTSCSIVLTSTYMECRINTKKIPINLAVRSGQVRATQLIDIMRICH